MSVEIKRLDADVAAAGQLMPGDIPLLPGAGFRSLVCNRPDGEEAGQAAYREIEAVAKENGLEVRFLPVVPGKIGEEDVRAFARLLEELPKPMIAYCRSGARSTTLWMRARELIAMSRS